MPWKTAANAPLGLPLPNGVADTERQVVVGTIAKFFDDVQGEGEFIYLPGLASVAAGDGVVYDLTGASASVARLVQNTFANSGRPVAFALGATPVNTWGWYQISGLAVVSAVAGVVAGAMMATATAGSVGNTADAGDQVLGARITTAVGTPAASKAYAMLNRPCLQGQIT